MGTTSHPGMRGPVDNSAHALSHIYIAIRWFSDVDSAYTWPNKLPHGVMYKVARARGGFVPPPRFTGPFTARGVGHPALHQHTASSAPRESELMHASVLGDSWVYSLSQEAGRVVGHLAPCCAVAVWSVRWFLARRSGPWRLRCVPATEPGRFPAVAYVEADACCASQIPTGAAQADTAPTLPPPPRAVLRSGGDPYPPAPPPSSPVRPAASFVQLLHIREPIRSAGEHERNGAVAAYHELAAQG